MNYLENQEAHPLAYEEFHWVQNKAIDAFPKVKGFENKVCII